MTLSVEKRLAAEFARQLCEELGFSRIAIVNSMNATIAYRGACASHDFCDANVTMGEAFRATFGRYPESDSAADSGLWSRAWDIAHESGFDVTRIKESE